ncbi:hypothetical protein [Methanosarcina lacustris]|uniref:hypothetical protein n=1 Tax=Methanosarcina lacustris TaxID=170861 RepID=UPI001E375A52|nr:hypothetical protein [Methanosarcina lacustris]
MHEDFDACSFLSALTEYDGVSRNVERRTKRRKERAEKIKSRKRGEKGHEP